MATNSNYTNFISIIYKGIPILSHVGHSMLFCPYRSGSEEKMKALITPLNVNCHAGDGRKVCDISDLKVYLICK